MTKGCMLAGAKGSWRCRRRRDAFACPRGGHPFRSTRRAEDPSLAGAWQCGFETGGWLVAGCWFLVVGYWLLVIGCWLLVVGGPRGRFLGPGQRPSVFSA